MHSAESLNRFRASANYLARKLVSDPSLRADAAQEGWVRAWQAPEGHALAYYERAIRNRILDVLRGASLGTNRTNNGGRGPLRVQSIQAMPDWEAPAFRRLEPSQTDEQPLSLAWAITACDTELDKTLVYGVALGLQIREIAESQGLNPRNVQRYWQRHTKPRLLKAWKETNI